jgi:hypothetical protein
LHTLTILKKTPHDRGYAIRVHAASGDHFALEEVVKAATGAHDSMKADLPGSHYWRGVPGGMQPVYAAGYGKIGKQSTPQLAGPFHRDITA